MKVFQVIAEYGEWEDACRDVVYTCVAATDEIAIATCRGVINQLRADIIAELRRAQAGITAGPNHQTVDGQLASYVERDALDLLIVAHPTGVVTKQRNGKLIERVTLQAFENMSTDPYEPVDGYDIMNKYYKLAEAYESRYGV